MIENRRKPLVIKGDCLKCLNRLEKESADLIYLDPPFFTQKNHVLSDNQGKTYSFSDKWKDNDYVTFMDERLIECFRVLKNDGIILVHCDTNSNYILRNLLNKIFKSKNFVNEIIWTYKRWSNNKRSLLKEHQTIFVYKKGSHYTFNKIYTEYSPTTNLDQILQKRIRDQNNKTVYMKNGENVVYTNEKKGVPLSDVWNIPYLNPKAKERVGYPTQKPLELLERLIRIFSNEGDLIVDPFCGSGTTLVASERLKRKAIGIDISEDAVKISKARINNPVKSESLLLKKGSNAYKFNDKEKEYIIKLFNAKPVYRNKGIDGLINTQAGIVALKIQGKNETLEESIQRLRKAKNNKKIEKGIVLRTHENLSFFNDKITESKEIKVIDSYKLEVNSILNG